MQKQAKKDWNKHKDNKHYFDNQRINDDRTRKEERRTTFNSVRKTITVGYSIYKGETEMRAVKIKESPDYYVTDTGCLYSRKNGRFRKLKLRPTQGGYFLARFQKTGKERIILSIHRLVAQTFIPNPDNKPEVNHKDGNKANNNVSNLEWVTHGENIKHSYDFLGRKHGMLGRKGKNSPYSKKIQQIKDNKVIAEFWGCFEAERITGIFAPNIWACLKNKRKTAGGYLWKYATEQ